MKIVTWNMGCGPRQSAYRKHHDRAWAYLLDELRPDVAFVQEALVTKLDDARRHHAVILCEHEPSAVGITAILARTADLSAAAPLGVTKASYAATAVVQTPVGPLALASIHMGTGKDQPAELLRVGGLLFSAFGPLPVLVGGDFNAARRWDEVYRKQMCGNFFDSMAAEGFHDAHWGIHGHEVQSFWRPGTIEAYQDDHFFISKAWASRLRACDVKDNATVREVSDHGPVVLELDVAST